MNLIKFLKERKSITAFFIICFTVGILIFSVGNSAIVSQKNKLKEFSQDNNKIITFRNYENIFLKDIEKLVKNKNITILILRGYMDEAIGVETYILPQDKELLVDMKSGTKLTRADLSGNNNNAIYSSRLDKDFQFTDLEKNSKAKINKLGIYYDMDRRLIINNKLFMNLYGDIDLNSSLIQVVFRGEPMEIDKVIKDIELELKNKNIKDGLIVNPLVIQDRGAEGQALYTAAIMIFIITIINSVSISSLWVKSRKKEIVVRKVFGAKNKDISKIFFGELVVISLISLILAITIQYILTKVTSGYIYNIDLRLNIETIINSFLIAIITSFSVSIPSLKYISKIQPAEMLKGE